jgi:acetylglutamate kinase
MTINHKPTLVLKIGGNQVEEPEFLAGFVTVVKQLLIDNAVVIVHGGGREISQLHAELGVTFETVEGLRATSVESQRLVKMALIGIVNTRLVRWLVNEGVEAIGISGVSLGLVRVSPMLVNGQSLGRVGQVQEVNAGALQRLLGFDLVPVVSPVSLGDDGLTYNVNADHMAAGLARGLAAHKLIFLSNVPGVQNSGHTLSSLAVPEVEALIADGVITDGMIPRVRSAMQAVNSGVKRAVITDLDGLAQEAGTTVFPEIRDIGIGE